VERAKKSLEQYDLKGHIKDAIHQLELAKDKASPNADLNEIRKWLGRAYWLSYTETQSIEERTRAASYSAQVTNKNLDLAYLVQGLVALNEGTNLPEAVRLLFRANQLYRGENCETLVRLADACGQLGDTTNAAVYFENAGKVGKKSWSDYNTLGWYYSQTGNLEAALTNFDEALRQTRQGSPLAWRNLGGVLMLCHETNEAWQACNKSFKLRKTPEAYSLKGSILLYKQRWQEAADNFLLAQTGRPTDYQLLGNAGLALLKITNRVDRQAEARAYLSNAVDKAGLFMPDSSNCLVKADMGLYRAALRQTNEAERCLREALDQCSNDSQVLWDADAAYVMLRDRSKADPIIQREVELSPGDRWVLEDAIDSYRQLGEMDKVADLQKQLSELQKQLDKMPKSNHK
jgi:tetratricopeptide (TPR) repeat protein